MLLSDIPLEYLLLKEDWLTGNNGVKGRIFSVSHHEVGIYHDIYVTIRWNYGTHEKLSLAKFPDDCTKIEVDMDMYPKMSEDYCTAQFERLVKQCEFWRTVMDFKEKEIPATGI